MKKIRCYDEQIHAYFDVDTKEIKDKVLSSKRYEVMIVLDQGFVCIYDKRKHRYGIARKHPKDKFDIDVALTLAYERLTGNIDSIDIYKTLDEMNIGEQFKFCFETVIFKGKYGSKYVAECRDGSNCYLDENKNFYKMI